MDLLSVFKRGSASPASVDTSPSLDSVATARRRARQRLIGATVLVVIAVVAFPMVFDATPRPVAVDVPIVIPRKDGSPPLAVPSGTSPDLVAPIASGTAPATAVASNGPAPATPSTGAGQGAAPAGAASSNTGVIITEGKDDAGTEVKPPVPDARVAMGQPGPPHVAKPAKPAPKAAEKVVEKAPEKPAPAKAESPRVADDASRAKALLENKPVAKADPAPAPKPAAAGDTRFVVQVAAFSSEAPVQEMRSKLDKAGVKSFSQAIDTPQGKRYRVRVGPFNSREEAEHAAAKIKSAGMSSSIVPL